MQYRSVADLGQTIFSNLHRLPRDADVVVGIPRSGLLAANLVALALNTPLADLDGFLEGRVYESGRTRRRTERDTAMAAHGIRKALVVDDSIHTGGSMREARAKVKGAGLEAQVVFCCVYGTALTSDLADIVLEAVPQPRIYQWNVMHHEIISRACVDIDGVLCCDPTDSENDDGEGYLRFLAEAPPLFRPTWPIGTLVTSRLERYRPQTEAWLRRQGIEYGALVMLDVPSAAERRRLGNHGRFKGTYYRDSKAELFIESEEFQAREIAAVSGKPVLSLDTGAWIRPEGLSFIAMTQGARSWRKRMLRSTARTVLGADGYEALRRALVERRIL